MVIIGTMAFPPESEKEMAERFSNAAPVPSFMTLRGPYVNSEVGVGNKIISIYEFDQSRIKEAYEFVLTRYSKYVGIPGFTYSVQPWLEMSD